MGCVYFYIFVSEKVIFSRLKLTFSPLKVTFRILKLTFSSKFSRKFNPKDQLISE